MDTMLRWLCFTLFVVTPARPQNVTDASAIAKKLFDEYFQYIMESSPQLDTILGYHNYPEDLDDLSFEAFIERGRKYKGFADRAQKLLETYGKMLPVDEKLFLKILEQAAVINVKMVDEKIFLFANVNHLKGVQLSMPSFFGDAGVQKLDTIQDFRRNLVRMRKIPKQLDQIIDLLKLGIKEGLTYHNASMFRVKKQFEILESGDVVEDSAFYKQFQKMAEKLGLEPDSADVLEVQNEAKSIISSEVLPAFKKLNNFIHTEYYLNLRQDPGMGSVANGHNIYQTHLESWTSLSGITPQEIHQFGLEEVERLRVKMMEVSEMLGLKNSTFKQFISVMQNDSSQIFKSEQEGLEFYREYIKKSNSKLNLLFGPKILSNDVFEVEIQPVPPGNSGLGYYRSASEDGKRKGTFYVNFQKIDALRKYETLTLTLHESNPGHHLQITYQRKNKNLPDFVKISFFPAFGEGWALYSEHLGHEMNLYKEDFLQLVGHYSFNLLRAVRLVVDTGIHAFGWSRERAIQYAIDNTAMDPHLCENQIDRYISWPGQATSYKIGERHIKTIRGRLEKELGKDFDVKHFHYFVLSCAGPLDIVETCIRDKMGPIRKAEVKNSAGHLSSNILISLVAFFFLKF